MLWPLNFKLLLMVDVKSLLSQFQALQNSRVPRKAFPLPASCDSSRFLRTARSYRACSWDKQVWWGTCVLLDGWLHQCLCMVWFAFFIPRLGIIWSHHSALAWWEMLEASFQTRLLNFTACCGRVLPSQCLTEARYPQSSTICIKPLAVFAVLAAGSKALGQSSQKLKAILYLIIFLLQKISAL